MTQSPFELYSDLIYKEPFPNNDYLLFIKSYNSKGTLTQGDYVNTLSFYVGRDRCITLFNSDRKLLAEQYKKNVQDNLNKIKANNQKIIKNVNETSQSIINNMNMA